MLGDIRPNNVLRVGLRDVAPAELDQDAVADIASGSIEHGRVVHAHLFAVLADLDRAKVSTELGGQPLLKMRDNNAVGMFAHKGLERIAELAQLAVRHACCERIKAAVQSPIVERDVHVFGEPGNRTEHLGQRSAAFERHRQAPRHREQGLQHPAHPDVFLQDDRGA